MSSALAPNKRIVIGLGSGRSGTASLTSLINRQVGGICFHEMNPACAIFSGNPQSPINTVREFRQILHGGDRRLLSIDYSRSMSVKTYNHLQAMGEVNLMGDIAFYYLNYVDALLAEVPECTFVCIRRDREETIASWLKKSSIKRWPSLWLGERLTSILTRTPFHTEYNYWQEHDGTRWRHDPIWDSAFPKLEADTREEAIGLYWDYYYLEADRLQRLYPDNFRVFDLADLSEAQGQRDILTFVGLDEATMVAGEAVHMHRSDVK